MVDFPGLVDELVAVVVHLENHACDQNDSFVPSIDATGGQVPDLVWPCKSSTTRSPLGIAGLFADIVAIRAISSGRACGPGADAAGFANRASTSGAQ